MKFKNLFFCILSIYKIFQMLKYYINWKARLKPLPTEVADIYDEEQYKKYIQHKKDYIPTYILNHLLNICIDCVMIYSNFLPWIEKTVGNNVYYIYFTTYFCLFVVDKIFEWPMSYYETFSIEQKYGLNKKSKKDFFKDLFVNNMIEILMTNIIVLFGIFVFENIGKWTNQFHIEYSYSMVVVGAISLACFLILLLLEWVQFKSLRMQYTFTEMEDNDLRKKIEILQDGSKKKVKHIKVYNESKKSNSKNAFLLTLLNYREFGIADNFLNENSENELLAVLSHEIGHLKHKKNILNYFSYIFIIIDFFFFVWLLPNASVIIKFINEINQEFKLQNINYYLIISIILTLYNYLNIILNIFNNYRKRCEEIEADYNAVKNGYGEEMIKTFKQISTDEFIDVNPSSFIEILDYDHPGMYKRIMKIKEMMNELQE